MNIMNPFKIVNEHVKGPAPVGLVELARDLGVSVREAPLDEDILGMIEKDEDGKYTISVNETLHPNRKRFTVAHELGHYILHRSKIGNGVDDDRLYRSTNSGKYHNLNFKKKQETEANRFAANILMPSHLIDMYHEQGITDPDQLAQKMQVSKQAMRIRLGLPTTDSGSPEPAL